MNSIINFCTVSGEGLMRLQKDHFDKGSIASKVFNLSIFIPVPQSNDTMMLAVGLKMDNSAASPVKIGRT